MSSWVSRYKQIGRAVEQADVLVVATPVYRLKKHLMKTVHNIDVVEV